MTLLKYLIQTKPPPEESPTIDESQYPALNPDATPFTPPDTQPEDTATDDPGPNRQDDDKNDDGTPGNEDDVPSDPSKIIPEHISKLFAAKMYINEDLTHARDYILFVARHAKKMNRINDCWAYNGTIRIKKLDNSIFAAKNFSDIPDYSAVLDDLKK